MPRYFDFFHKSNPPQHNLQEGLFQIASQTCNLLVQVNNTNNISFGSNATNISTNNIPLTTCRANTSSTCAPNSNRDSEQLVVLLPNNAGNKGRRKSFCRSSSFRKPRLSTVLEGPILSNEEEGELWNNGYVLPVDHDGSPSRRWGSRNAWCRPSCIPISIIMLLIFLVVLLPVLNHTAYNKPSEQTTSINNSICPNACRLQLVESIPEGLIYINNTLTYPTTYQTWMNLIENSTESIDIASFYWTLRATDVHPEDGYSSMGEDIFQAILRAGTDRALSIRIAQNAPTQDQPNRDTELLVKRRAAQVRSLNFVQFLGAGVLHTKLWIFDKKHFYIGSANMDWRSLSQVKELGIVVQDCECLAEDVQKIFEVYWKLGDKDAKIPETWPTELETNYNIATPINIYYANNSEVLQMYISSSPHPLSPHGRSDDIDSILSVIRGAERFVHIAVMDYFPQTIYSAPTHFWPVLDNIIRQVALEERVQVKMLISWWNHSRPSEDYFLRSLQALNGTYPKMSVEIRRFIVPSSADQQKIPFARVNHNKYVVTDNTAYIGTSNWSADYFINTAGVGFVVHDPKSYRNNSAIEENVRSQLQAIFERDWASNYAFPLVSDILNVDSKNNNVQSI